MPVSCFWEQNFAISTFYASLTLFDLPEHVFPLPEKPRTHVHMNDPLVLVQTALTSQLWDLVEHSSISAKKGRGNEHGILYPMWLRWGRKRR